MNKNLLIILPLGVFLLIGIFWFNSKTDPAPAETNENPEPKNMVQHGVDFSNGQSVDVIDYEGDYLLVSKLRVGESHPAHATGPGCGDKHWHADDPVTAVNNGRVLSDPLTGGCGFGTLSERPVMMYFPNELLAE